MSQVDQMTQMQALTGALPQLSPAVSWQGKEYLDLLEITTGKSILEEDPHWYSKSRLYPLANLDRDLLGFMIWSSFAETSAILRTANPFSDFSLVQINEYKMMIVGQGSRALKGLERQNMTTTNYRIQMQNPEQQQRRGGILGWFTGGR